MQYFVKKTIKTQNQQLPTSPPFSVLLGRWLKAGSHQQMQGAVQLKFRNIT